MKETEDVRHSKVTCESSQLINISVVSSRAEKVANTCLIIAS